MEALIESLRAKLVEAEAAGDTVFAAVIRDELDWVADRIAAREIRG